MSFTGGEMGYLFGEKPTPPGQPKKRWWPPHLSSLAAVARGSVEQAPPSERQFWSALGAGYLVVCLLSGFAGVVIVAMQIGQSARSVWYVGVIWFLVMVVVERLIAATIRPNMNKLVVLLIALRIGLSLLIGYQIAEPLVVLINHKAVDVQVTKDIQVEQLKRADEIGAQANARIRIAQNKRATIQKRQRHKENAVYFWEHATCAAGTKECVAKHHDRLQMAQERLDQFVKNNGPTLSRLNETISSGQTKRQHDVHNSNVAIAQSNDIFARQHALGALMNKSLWLTFWVYAARLIFLIFDLTPVLSKTVMVRRGTVVGKVDAADEAEWGAVQDDRLARALVDQVGRERVVEKAPEIVDQMLDEKTTQLLENVRGDRARLRVVPDQDALAAERRERAAEAEAYRREMAVERAKLAETMRQRDEVAGMTQYLVAPTSRFKLTNQLLGAGTTGSVWLAFDVEKNNDRVAVKLPKTKKFHSLHKEEQEKLERLRHPNIVRFIASFELANGTPAIVLEFVPGTSLREEIDKRQARGATFAEDEMLTVVLPILDALDYLHREGLVHQDVKPGNILGWGANDSRGIRLGDFGIASAIGRAPALVGGTRNYMPAEQVRGSALDERSDLFAVGVITFEMLAGFNPFADDAEQQFTRERPPQIRDIGKYTDDLNLAKLIAVCLAFDPNDRPQTARQLIDELRKATGKLATPIHDSAADGKQSMVEDEFEQRRPDPDKTPGYEADHEDEVQEERNP
jgi:hypothetical protein